VGNHTAVKRARRENRIHMANQENGEFIRGAMTTDPDYFSVGTLSALQGKGRGQGFAHLLSNLYHTWSIVGVAVYGNYLIQKSEEITLEGLNSFSYFLHFQASLFFHLRSTRRDRPRCV